MIAFIVNAFAVASQVPVIATVRGRLVDEHLRPIVDEQVVFSTSIGGCAWYIKPVRIITAADGTFVARDLVGERHTLRVTIRGRIALRETVLLRDECWLDLRVDRGARLEGVVRDGDGQPIRNAQVSVCALALARVAGGVGGVTDAEGRYRVAGIPAGVWQLEAAHDRDWVTATASGEDGELVTRDFTIPAGTRGPHRARGARSIVGSVLDSDGRPLTGWTVTLCPWLANEDHRTVTDDRGGFELVTRLRAPRDVCELLVTNPAARVGFPFVAAEGIDARPGAPPCVLQLRSTDEPTARVRGAIRDARGNAHPDLVLRVSHRLWKLETDVNAVTGSFQTEPLPEGRYRLEVLERDRAMLRPCLQLGTRIVERGRDLDLGEVRAPW